MSDEEKPASAEPQPKRRIGKVEAMPRTLSTEHREHLRTSGLTDETIDLAGFYSTRGTPCAELIHWRAWPRGMGEAIAIPFFTPDAIDRGAPPFFHRVRPDHPRTNEKTGKVAKYEQPKGVGVAPYFPARSRLNARYSRADLVLVVTEGEKKACALDQLGYASIGGVGVSCFHDVEHRKETDEYRFHELIRKHVAFAGRTVVICFDSDQLEKEQVMRAARVVAMMAYAAGAERVLNAVPTVGADGKKRGIDDVLAAEGPDAVKAIVDSAELVPRIDDHVDTVHSHEACKTAPIDPRLRMPRGYSFDRDGALYLDDGKDTPDQIERAPLLLSRLVADLYTNAELVEMVYRRSGAWRTVTVPRRTMVDARALVSELGAIGAPVDGNTASKVVRWLRDYEAINEKRLARARALGRCGWHDVDGRRVFVLASEVIGGGEGLVAGRSVESTRLSKGIRTSGSQEAQVAALRSAFEASAVCGVAIAAAIAAPLLRIMGLPNFAVHLAGDSSRGKSSMLKVAASVYGDPRDDEWVASWNSTTVGHEQRAAHHCDLPLCLDEAGVVDPKLREQAVYMLVNGVGRTRGAKEGGLRETQSWRTVALSTGERQLYEESSATGAQVRVLQLQVDRFGDLDAAGVDALRRACEENFGWLGRDWVQRWAEASAETIATVKAEMRAVVRAFQAAATGGLAARQAETWGALAYVEALLAQTYQIGSPLGAGIKQVYLEVGEGNTREAVRAAYERAVDVVREWMAGSATAFPHLVLSTANAKVTKKDGPPPRDVCGYIDDREGLVYLLPGALRERLGEAGIDDRVVLRDWRAKAITRASEERHTTEVRIDGVKRRVIAVTGDALGVEGVASVASADDFG